MGWPCCGGYPGAAPVLMGGSGLLGRPWACWAGCRPPGGAYVYEGGRPRGLFGFMLDCCWPGAGGGRLFVLVLEGCGESELGRWAGVPEPWGEGEGLLDALLRFEPTRFLKRAFMEFIEEGGAKGGGGLPGGSFIGSTLRLIQG